MATWDPWVAEQFSTAGIDPAWNYTPKWRDPTSGTLYNTTSAPQEGWELWYTSPDAGQARISDWDSSWTPPADPVGTTPAPIPDWVTWVSETTAGIPDGEEPFWTSPTGEVFPRGQEPQEGWTLATSSGILGTWGTPVEPTPVTSTDTFTEDGLPPVRTPVDFYPITDVYRQGGITAEQYAEAKSVYRADPYNFDVQGYLDSLPPSPVVPTEPTVVEPTVVEPTVVEPPIEDVSGLGEPPPTPEISTQFKNGYYQDPRTGYWLPDPLWTEQEPNVEYGTIPDEAVFNPAQTLVTGWLDQYNPAEAQGLSDSYFPGGFYDPRSTKWSPVPIFVNQNAGQPYTEADLVGKTFNQEAYDYVPGWEGEYVDKTAAANEAATVDPYDFGTLMDWAGAQGKLWASEANNLLAAYQGDYEGFINALTGPNGLLANLPELDAIDYTIVDQMLTRLEGMASSPSEIASARDQAAQDLGFTDWNTFQAQLASWEGAEVDYGQIEDDAAGLLGYASWADYQQALQDMGYTELTAEQIREQAALDLGYNSWQEYQDDVTAAGGWTPQTDEENRLQAAKDLGFNTWEEYIAAREAAGNYVYGTDQENMDQAARELGFDNWDALSREKERLSGKVEEGTDEQAARESVAQNLGFGSWEELQTEINRLRGLERSDMEGLTEEEKAQYDRQQRQAVASEERRSSAQLEAIFANTGSMTQYLSAADEENRRISDTRLQYEMAQMNQDIGLQIDALSRSDRIYSQLLDSSQTGISQNIQAQLQELQMANQQYLTLLEQGAQQVRSIEAADISKAGIAEQRYGTLMDAGLGRLGDIEQANLSEGQLMAQRFATLFGAGADRVGGITQEQMTRTGMADARIRDLRSQGTEAYGMFLDAEIQRVTTEQQKFIQFAGMGSTNVQSILDNRIAGVTAALNGYMAKAALQLQEYGAEVSGVVASADIIYKGAMTQLGIDSGVYELLESNYNMKMKPIIDQISLVFEQQGADAATMAAWGSLIGGIGEALEGLFGGGVLGTILGIGK